MIYGEKTVGDRTQAKPRGGLTGFKREATDGRRGHSDEARMIMERDRTGYADMTAISGP